jgi:hypothetical protein
MMRTWAVLCVASMWVVTAGLFWAAGVALRAAVKRRLVFGSRLFVWREPIRVIQGPDAVRTSLITLVIISLLAVIILAASIKATNILRQAYSSPPRLPKSSL